MSEKKARLKRKSTPYQEPHHNSTPPPNRSEVRKQKYLDGKKNNLERQIVPARYDWVEEENDLLPTYEKVADSKVIFHKKQSNLPRLYPNMKG